MEQKAERKYTFAEALTKEEAKTLLAHLPKPGRHIGRAVAHDENPVLFRALEKLEWQSEQAES